MFTKLVELTPVVLESPYAGDVKHNLEYAHQCIRDCLQRGESPIASHVLYTTALDDSNPSERQAGISAIDAWLSHARYVVVYTDKGISLGMLHGIKKALLNDIPIRFRSLSFDSESFMCMNNNAGQIITSFHP